MKSRILILFSMFLGLWSLLIVRAMFIQVFPDSRLENLKRKQFETSLSIHTRRGAILDRNGKELAASVPAYSLFADPKILESSRDLTRRLAGILKMPPEVIRKRLKHKEKRFVWIRRQLTEKQRDEIRKWNLPGLGFIEEPRRIYPNGSLMSQVLGFVGSEGGGLEGLELRFNKDLEGQLKQILLPRDARGRPLLEDGRSLSEVPDGSDLTLTIDHEIQFTLERELKGVVDRFEATSAIGIVMDPQSFEILAMANLPSADMNDGRRVPMALKRDRAVVDAFEPGSTLKTFVIATALKDGVVRPSTRYNCEGGRMKVGDKWITEAETKEKFNWLNVTEILAHSSNVGAAKIAFDLGDQRLFRGLADFGFGTKTGIDLPGEARGIVNPLPWYQHLLSNIAFGQGIAVTPLQLAAAYSVIANGGVLKRPLLVRSISTRAEGEPKIFQAEEVRRVLSVSEAATMRLMLTAATEENGTGLNARIPGYYVAGKTGTAQVADLKKGGYLPGAYISSFAGFVPAHDPRYVILIAVDNPRKAYYGSQVAAPVFARMAQYLVRRAGLPPVLISERNVISTPIVSHRSLDLQKQALEQLQKPDLITEASASNDGFPNLMGMTLREALNRLRQHAGPVEIKGHGMVVRTSPRAGDHLWPRQRVRIILENPD